MILFIRLLQELLATLLVLATLPLVAELAIVTGARLLPRRRYAALVDEQSLRLAVIVPAHNEGGLVARCVESILASATGATRLYVVVHNSTDDTASKAATAGAEVLVFDDPAARGKGFALRRGFEHGMRQGCDAVLVIDADSLVSTNLIAEVKRSLANGAEVVQCRYDMETTNARPNARISELALRAFNLIRPSGRERLGLSAGILGNGFAICTHVLEQVPYHAFSIVEDLEYHLELVMAGKRVRFLENCAVTATLPPSTRGETVQRSRWEGGRFGVSRQWSLPMARRVMRGQVRLLEPLLDLLGLPLAYGVFALLLTLAIPMPWIRIYGAMSLAIVLTHVLTAAWAGPDFAGTLGLLVRAPIYIVWKLRMLPGVLRDSKARAVWVPTERDAGATDVS